MLIQVKGSELKELREKWYVEQDGVCPILKVQIPLERAVVDHQHKLKSEEADESGKGLCRGCIDRNCNSFEGRVTKSYKRSGLAELIDLPTLLRNLADYLEKNKIHEEEQFIHPSEAPRKPKLMKSSYNKLVKAVNKERKVPKYTGNFTKSLQALFEKYQLEPEFY